MLPIPEIKQYEPTAQAIAALLNPYAEVVLHDLATDRIVGLYNCYSQRVIGDDSLLEEDELDLSQDVIGPYEKRNWDGRRLKSISVVIRNAKRKAVGLMCINLDISQFEAFSDLIQRFINPPAMPNQPEILFKDDWQERINIFVHSYLQQQHKHIDALTKSEKQTLIGLLEQEGAFKGKNAAAYVGRILRLSRATVYNYLAEHSPGKE